MNESCCSFRLISRTRKIVFSTSPAMIIMKKMNPSSARIPSRQFRISQLTFSVTAMATRQMPKMLKKIAFRCRGEITLLSYRVWPVFRPAQVVAFAGDGRRCPFRSTGEVSVRTSVLILGLIGALSIPAAGSAEPVTVHLLLTLQGEVNDAHATPIFGPLHPGDTLQAEFTYDPLAADLLPANQHEGSYRGVTGSIGSLA